MTVYHAATILTPVSGVPEDIRQQSWYAEDPGQPPGVAEAAIIGGLVEEMYTQAVGGGAGLGTFISNSVSRVALACAVRVWSIDGATGAETFVVEIPFTMPVATSGGLYPGEVACRLSIHGALDGSEADRSKRGGPFLGPLSDGTGVNDGNGTLRPTAGLMAQMIARYQEFDDGLVANGMVPVVWSRTTLTAHTVVGGWVDDAFDTQRRRGGIPTSRSVFTV